MSNECGPIHRLVGSGLLVVVVSLTMTSPVVAQLPTVSPATDGSTAQPDDVTFAVTQGGECYQVTPVGNAFESVSSFYDYTGRNSQGTGDFQKNQASNLLIFHGTDGYSLVLIHDKHDEFGDAEYGGTLTMEFLGLPEDGEWVLEDDNYEGRDDEFIHRGTRSKINWMWIGGRNDGGAFRGLNTDDLELTIVPRFNEDAEAWNRWDASGDENNRTEEWRLFTDRDTTVNLDMNEELTITRGACDAAATAPAITASSRNVTAGEPVLLDARELTDEPVVSEYYWDVDGDGEADRTSTGSSITHEYQSPGNYTATVQVREEGNTTATGQINLSVAPGQSDGGSEQPTDQQTETPTSGTTTSSSGPGFGVVAVVLALLVSLGLLGRRS